MKCDVWCKKCYLKLFRHTLTQANYLHSPFTESCKNRSFRNWCHNQHAQKEGGIRSCMLSIIVSGEEKHKMPQKCRFQILALSGSSKKCINLRFQFFQGEKKREGKNAAVLWKTATVLTKTSYLDKRKSNKCWVLALVCFLGSKILVCLQKCLSTTC